MGAALQSQPNRPEPPCDLCGLGPERSDRCDYQLQQPAGLGDQIRAAVEQGLIVRTRGDDALIGLAGDDTQLKAALASGAHLISTDFSSAPAGGVDYHASIPGGTPSRCNPLTAPVECTSESIEDPRRLAGD